MPSSPRAAAGAPSSGQAPAESKVELPSPPVPVSGLGREGTADTERPPPVASAPATVASAPATVASPAGFQPASSARVVTVMHGVAPESGGSASSARSPESGAPRPSETKAEPRMTRHCPTCDAWYPGDFLVCPRDASPLVEEAGADADPRVGTLAGETYQIVRVVGEGGMGRVYEARHLRLKERRFAIKTLHADLAKNPEIVARFLREAESASSLSHPHVVDVFDVHHFADGTPYLVGEFLEGEELAEHVAKHGPLSPASAAVIGHQICSALAAAHARGIVHRDMKPENVFVLRPPEGRSDDVRTLRVKILDFGISKVRDERTHLTRTGMIMGTPSYMAPEQARGQAVDHRADVYAVGAVLYFALTGQKPFDSEDPTSTLTLVLTRDPERLRTLAPTIPEALELVVQKAMAKDPADRFESMPELARALRAFDRTGGLVSIGVPGPTTLDAPAGKARRLSALDAWLRTGDPASQAGPATYARPTIVVASVVLAAWVVSAVAAALAGIVRALHGDELTGTESVLLGVACLLASLTPGVLYVNHVRRAVWPNSVRAIEHATDLRRAAVFALVTYGFVALALRVFFTVVVRETSALFDGRWDLLFLVASGLAAAFGGGLGVLARRRKKARGSRSG